MQFWRACGCPPQFRPRLPWWQPSSGVGSFSPVGSAVSRSQPQCHQTKSASPPVAERKTQPTTTNHNCARREPSCAWSRRAPHEQEVSSPMLGAKSVRAALAPRDPPRSALITTKRSAQPANAIHHRTLVAARGCCRSCPPAPRLGGHRAASPLIGRHSPRPSHCPRARRRPHQFESWQRCRTSRVVGRPSRARASTRKLALRGISTMRR